MELLLSLHSYHPEVEDVSLQESQLGRPLQTVDGIIFQSYCET